MKTRIRGLFLIILAVVLCVVGKDVSACILPPTVGPIDVDPCTDQWTQVTVTAYANDSAGEIVPFIVVPTGGTLVSTDRYPLQGKRVSVIKLPPTPDTYSIRIYATNSGGTTNKYENVLRQAPEETFDMMVCPACPDAPCEPNDIVHPPNGECEEMGIAFPSSIFESTGVEDGEIAADSTASLRLKRPFSLLAPHERASQISLGDGRKIRMRQFGSDVDGLETSGPMAPKNIGGWAMPGGEGCSSCTGSSGVAAREIKYHNMQVNLASRQDNTLAHQSKYLDIDGSDNVDANINIAGDWFAVHQRGDWSAVKYEATIDFDGDSQVDDDVIGFKVTDPDGHEYYYYELGTTTIPDTPKLRKVIRKTDISTTETITYNYTGSQLTSQQDESGKKIEYLYNASEDLNQLKFYNGSSYDRTVDFAYDSNGKLSEVDCGSCSGAQVRYEYDASEQLKYDPVAEDNVPARRFVTAIKDSAGDKVADYVFDSKDRVTKHYLGSSTTGDLVTEWVYTDDSSGNLQEILRKDFVDGTDYRATVYNYNTDGSLASVVRYHDLQSGTSPSGDNYSTVSYSSSDDEANDVTRSITQLPSVDGTTLKEITELVLDDTDDADGYPKRKLVEYDDGSTTTTWVKAQYDYDEYGSGDTQILLASSKNAQEGETHYYYDSNFKKTKTLSPAITSGVTSNLPAQTDSRTVYDTLERVTYELHKNSNGDWVGKHYLYDSNGHLDKVKDGVVFTLNNEGLDIWTVNTVTDTGAVVTDYTYNAFGELTETAVLDGSDKKNIRRTYYDDGIKIGQAIVLTEEVGDPVTTEAQLISATKYTYDANGKLIITSVVKADAAFPEADLSGGPDVDDLEDDLAVTLNTDSDNDYRVTGGLGLDLTWVHTVNVYDDYGRRTAVINDAKESGDTTRDHLKTEYAYNHQGEVTEVKSPDGKVVQTTRDGRGLVEKEETGYYSGSTFTAEITVEYTYDDNSNLKTRTEPHPDGDGRKVKTVYVYDPFNRQKGTYTEEIAAP